MMVVASRNIDCSASSDEWKHLYKWVEDQTLTFRNTQGPDKEPWLMSKASSKDTIERIHQANVAGWVGPWAGMF